MSDELQRLISPLEAQEERLVFSRCDTVTPGCSGARGGSGDGAVVAGHDRHLIGSFLDAVR